MTGGVGTQETIASSKRETVVTCAGRRADVGKQSYLHMLCHLCCPETWGLFLPL